MMQLTSSRPLTDGEPIERLSLPAVQVALHYQCKQWTNYMPVLFLKTVIKCFWSVPFEEWSCGIDRSCHKYNFCCDKHVFVTTKHVFCYNKSMLLLRLTYFCCDKHDFVVTQAYFCHYKHVFVMTKHAFCHNKSMLVVTELVVTNMCHDKHVFVATKVLSRQTYFCHDKSCFVMTNTCGSSCQ